MSTGTDQLRRHIPHVHDLGIGQLESLLDADMLIGCFTEKTDGMAFEIGFDLLGFYTRSATSPKIRTANGYADTLKAKFGDKYNPKLAERFDHVHSLFYHNRALQSYLRRKRFFTTGLSGEIFYRPDAKIVDGMLQFETILYNPFKIGVVGSFVVHTQMPLNKTHFMEEFKALGNHTLKFDDDAVSDRLFIDVTKERSRLETVDKVLLRSRKAKHRDDKANEQQKVREIAQSLSDKMRIISNGLVPKWGYQTEGYVFHPENKDMRVKVISDLFKANFDGRKYDADPQGGPDACTPTSYGEVGENEDADRNAQFSVRPGRLF